MRRGVAIALLAFACVALGCGVYGPPRPAAVEAPSVDADRDARDGESCREH